MAKIQIFHGAGNSPETTFEDRDLPDVEEGEILAEVCLATICGSDLHTLSGKRTEATPSVLGHEAVVKILKSRRCGFSPGQRISFSIANSCKKCRFCNIGVPQKCSSLFKYGHALLSNGSGFNGCYATHILIRSGTHVTHVPANVTDKMAAPANCALATAVCGVEKINNPNQINQVAVVQGAGLMGLYACAILKESGYDVVYCSDIDTERLSLVPAFGGVPLSPDNPKAGPLDGSVDVVLEVCGVKSVFKDGLRLLRPGGTYILIGMVHPDSQLDVTGEQIIRKCLTITGVHNYAPSHLDSAIEFLSKTADKYPYERLVGEVYSLADLDEAVALATSRKFVRVGVM